MHLNEIIQLSNISLDPKARNKENSTREVDMTQRVYCSERKYLVMFSAQNISVSALWCLQDWAGSELNRLLSRVSSPPLPRLAAVIVYAHNNGGGRDNMSHCALS